MARAIFASFYGEGEYKPVQWVTYAARAAIAAADGPTSVEVREQMLCERYGSRAPRAMWPVS